MDRIRIGHCSVVIVAIAAILGVVAGYATRIAPRWLEVVRLRIALPGLPDQWTGIQIAHLSDFHAGGAIPLELLRRAKAIALADSPDVVALTGDFYNEGVRCEVGDLFTRWPEGLPVLAILGNHDHRATEQEYEQLRADLLRGGVTMLENASVRIVLRGRPAWIVGVDDPYSWRMDVGLAFADVPTGDDVLLYLAHSPVATNSMPIGRVRLMLAGHTHGGQVRLTGDGRVPMIALVRRLFGNPERADPDVHRGVHWRHGTVVVISNGLGVSKVPWRFRTRPQVILIELKRASAAGPACDEVGRYVTRLNPPPFWQRWLS